MNGFTVLRRRSYSYLCHIAFGQVEVIVDLGPYRIKTTVPRPMSADSEFSYRCTLLLGLTTASDCGWHAAVCAAATVLDK